MFNQATQYLDSSLSGAQRRDGQPVKTEHLAARAGLTLTRHHTTLNTSACKNRDKERQVPKEMPARSVQRFRPHHGEKRLNQEELNGAKALELLKQWQMTALTATPLGLPIYHSH